ncbi:hypothetical protein CFP56_032208 [Quercus suber]|uniref:Uncharacterized protein n=1 Tax=Quercus suber TaxID=58331 RepID=A0AAW0JHV8_QUESU
MSKNTPKIEEDNGSDLDPTKIKPYTWPSLAKPMKLPHPQKCFICPLFNILLLVVFAATVNFRAVLCRVDINLSVWSLQKKTHVLNFNSTLLKYASVDIFEPHAKQEIEQLLGATFQAKAGTEPSPPTSLIVKKGHSGQIEKGVVQVGKRNSKHHHQPLQRLYYSFYYCFLRVIKDLTDVEFPLRPTLTQRKRVRERKY